MDSSSISSSSTSKCTASAILTETEHGCHCLKVTPYSLTKGIGIGKSIKSCTFTVGEHSWVITYYPDGLQEQDAEYIALFLNLTSYSGHAKVQFTLGLVDQNGSLVPQYTFGSEIHTFSNAGSNWGFRSFIKRADLEASKYLKDDCVTFRCDLTIIKDEEFVVNKFLSSLGSPLGRTSRKGEATSDEEPLILLDGVFGRRSAC